MLSVTLFLHVMAAIFWVGGMLFLALVVVPFVNTIDDFPKRAEVYKKVGTTFRLWGWVAIGTLVVTGPLNMYYMGVHPFVIFDPAFHSTDYGKLLMIKVGFVLLLVLSSLFHDFYVGPRARTSEKLAWWASIMGRSNLAVAIIIVIMAVLMRTHMGG